MAEKNNEKFAFKTDYCLESLTSSVVDLQALFIYFFEPSIFLDIKYCICDLATNTYNFSCSFCSHKLNFNLERRHAFARLRLECIGLFFFGWNQELH